MDEVNAMLRFGDNSLARIINRPIRRLATTLIDRLRRKE
jgi:hypothetical protein